MIARVCVKTFVSDLKDVGTFSPYFPFPQFPFEIAGSGLCTTALCLLGPSSSPSPTGPLGFLWQNCGHNINTTAEKRMEITEITVLFMIISSSPSPTGPLGSLSPKCGHNINTTVDKRIEEKITEINNSSQIIHLLLWYFCLLGCWAHCGKTVATVQTPLLILSCIGEWK